MNNVAISGIAPGPGNAGGMNNVAVDPSGVGNASRIAPLPQAHTDVPAIPRTASQNPGSPSLTVSGQQLLDAPVGHRQPRADQVPSEKNLMDPNDPVNKENAALDRMINGICRGC
jgi:hypothetical protein